MVTFVLRKMAFELFDTLWSLSHEIFIIILDSATHMYCSVLAPTVCYRVIASAIATGASIMCAGLGC